MFILVPLALILASVVGISVIVYRKMPYLNKLTPEMHPSAREDVVGDFLTDLFPEFSEGFKSLKLKEYGNLWLIELEKFIRKLRVVSLKMDRISDSWIKKIRKGHGFRATTSINSEKITTEEIPVLKAKHAPQITLEEMKREEQRLIIEIAKNPKDSKLYEVLGDLYSRMNNFSDAKESFEAAIELSPSSESLKQKLSKVLGKLSSQN